MIPTPFVPRYETRFNIRPLKHAYFVLNDNWETCRRAVRMACTQWGGVRSLLIPVSGDDAPFPWFTEHMLRLHEPDRFVDYAFETRDNSDRRELLRLRLRALWPNRDITVNPGANFDQWDTSAHVLWTLPDEDDRRRSLVVHRFRGPRTHAALLSLLFGEIFPGQGQVYGSQMILKPREIRLADPTQWSEQAKRDPYASVLNLTGHDVMAHSVSGGFGASDHFEIFLVRSLESACAYWNLRATREATEFGDSGLRRTWLLPYDLLQQPEALERLAETVRRLVPTGRFAANVQLWFSYWGDEEGHLLREALSRTSALRHHKSKITARHGSRQPRSIGTRPLRFVIAVPPLPKKFQEGVGRLLNDRVEFANGRNYLLLAPPAEYLNRSGGGVAVDLQSGVWDRYPKTRSIADAILGSSWFTRYGLTCAFGLWSHATHLSVDLPTEADALEMYFRDRGYSIRPSTAGRYGSALVGLIGSVWHLGELASPLALRVLEALAVRNPKKFAQWVLRQAGLISPSEPALEERIVQVLAQHEVELSPALRDAPKTLEQLTGELGISRDARRLLLVVIERLVDLGVVRRGYWLRCPNCAARAWYGLEETRERVRCPGCGAVYLLPVRASSGTDEMRWYYTLNSLADRVMDHDVLPALFALRHLAQTREVACIAPGLELLKNGKVECEFDLVFVSNGELSAGECKAGVELGAKDLEAARTASKLGVNHYYFCSLKTFTVAAKMAVDTLRSELSQVAGTAPPMTIEVLGEQELLNLGSPAPETPPARL